MSPQPKLYQFPRTTNTDATLTPPAPPRPGQQRMTKQAEAQDVTFDFTLPESGKMKEAEQFLIQHAVNYRQTNANSLKIGHVNYYPDKGTVCLDGHRKYNHTGLQFLLAVLQREGLAK